MRITLHSQDLPRELRDLMIDQRVTLEVTFDVRELHLDSDEHTGESISGQVMSHRVGRVTGGGGTDPTVMRGINELRKLRVRSMGTSG